MQDDDYRSLTTNRLRDDDSPVMTPEHYLWLAMMDMAHARVESVLNFARNWTDIRFNMDYERQRTRCLFHLSWLFDDYEGARFTFRQLCQFSSADDLRDVKVARKRILQAFSKQCLESLAKPVDDRVLKSVMVAWVSAGPSVKTQTRARTPVVGLENSIETDGEIWGQDEVREETQAWSDEPD